MNTIIKIYEIIIAVNEILSVRLEPCKNIDKINSKKHSDMNLDKIAVEKESRITEATTPIVVAM